MKCLLQDLWKEEIQWDDPLPTHIEKEWKKWCEELPHLRNLKIPRPVLDSTLLEDDVELHSFCDASKKAYGAAIYLRTKSRNGISVKLVTSKSRVAPLNCVTLPRLELLGALVAARLASKVKRIVNLKRSCLQYHWTDSKIVLFWIKGNKTRWKQFVANRVNEITSLTDPHSWYHCAGKENPADFLSCGLSADCLVSNSRWWTGAEFLSNSEFPKNFQQVVPELDYLTEHEKETVVQERKKKKSLKLTEVKRLFNYNCRNKSKKVGPLTVAEFKESEIKLIKHAQRSLFDKKEIPSSISNLFSFVDGEGIVRVGGRLENASVPYLHKHPAILPKGSKLSKLYFNSLHTRLFHVGPQGLLNAVRQKCWPLSGRSITRKTVHQCVTCFKSKPILSSQIMGNLPSERYPHFGGLWEAGVKSVKHHLKRAIGNLHFTFEELETIMIQVEGILNSRPLTPLSSDADNFDVLTRGHFLIGDL
ncbi:integrase catalytic domain-containing protein [Trichonephila clavipes]|nr:integrase catalytic domain-containing protein [Trichonephila clavipes]